MPGRNFLFVPGPTNVPDRILRAMHVPQEDHRSSSFPDLTIPLLRDLRKIFKTETGQVIIFPGTGTGGWEAALVNTLSPGDKVLMVETGHFATLWRAMADRLKLDVEFIPGDWRHGAKPEDIAAHLAKDKSHAIKAVMVVHNETSTGVTSRIPDIRKAIDSARHPALLLVDTISSLGSIEYDHDGWGVDVTVSCSQKGLMLPPGLAFVSVSEKAWAHAEKAKNAAFYFNFKKERENQVKNQTAFIPTVSLIIGLQEVIKMLKAEGLEKIFARQGQLARAMREGMQAAGLSLFPKESPSDALTAVSAPDGVDGQAIYKNLRVQYGITAAGGQDHLKGKIFRLSHMGYADRFDVITAMAATEMVLKGLGHPVKLGSGVNLIAGATTLTMAGGNDVVADTGNVLATAGTPVVLGTSDGVAPALGNLTLNGIPDALNGDGAAGGTLQVPANGFTIDLTFFDASGIDVSRTVISANATVGTFGLTYDASNATTGTVTFTSLTLVSGATQTPISLCAPQPTQSSTTTGGGLAQTGTNLTWLLVTAVALILVGAATVLVLSRRRAHE